MEEKICFQCGNLKLEGILSIKDQSKGIVITHPHPLYGGNMYNPVVRSIHEVFSKNDYSTLRFNFRGTGKSEGSHEKGQGEINDVVSAIEYLKEKSIEPVVLAGYSFGGWVNSKIDLNPFSIDNIIWISPPIGMNGYEEILYHKKIKLIITGDRDDIAPYLKIKEMVQSWNQDIIFEKIEGADHIFMGKIKELKAAIENNFDF